MPIIRMGSADRPPSGDSRYSTEVSAEREADLLREFDTIVGADQREHLAKVIAWIRAARGWAAQDWPTLSTAKRGMEEFADDLVRVNRYIEASLAKASRIGLATDNKFETDPLERLKSADQQQLEALATEVLPKLQEMRKLAQRIASVDIERNERVKVNVMERGAPERECCSWCARLLVDAGQIPRSQPGSNLERVSAIAWELATGKERDFSRQARDVSAQWRTAQEDNT
jgi:hypothetical protein